MKHLGRSDHRLVAKLQRGRETIVVLARAPLRGVASGFAFKGFIWEDFTVDGRLYFVTTDGNVWGLATPTTNPATWKRKPVASGTVSQMLPSDTALWVGGSDGNLYQVNLTTGALEGSSFAVGGGGTALGPVSTETGSELYVATSTGRLYKITLTGGNLP